MQPQMIINENNLFPESILFGSLKYLSKGFTHDGNQHVHEDHWDHVSCNKENEHAIILISTFSESICCEIAKSTNHVHRDNRINNLVVEVFCNYKVISTRLISSRAFLWLRLCILHHLPLQLCVEDPKETSKCKMNDSNHYHKRRTINYDLLNELDIIWKWREETAPIEYLQPHKEDAKCRSRLDKHHPEYFSIFIEVSYGHIEKEHI